MNKLSWDGSNFMIQAGRPTFHSLANSDFEVSHYFRPHLPIEADGWTGKLLGNNFFKRKNNMPRSVFYFIWEKWMKDQSDWTQFVILYNGALNWMYSEPQLQYCYIYPNLLKKNWFNIIYFSNKYRIQNALRSTLFSKKPHVSIFIIK